MRITIECTGEMEGGEIFRKYYTSSATTRMGQNRVLNKRCKQFWYEHPSLVDSEEKAGISTILTKTPI